MKGLVQIYTGDGKGKTTAAIGLTVRALGQDCKIFFAQFLKSGDTGEKRILDHFSENIIFYRPIVRNKGFIWKMTDRQVLEIREDIIEAWDYVREQISSGEYDVVVLDEILGVLSYGFIDINHLVRCIKERPDHVEIVMTGRDAPDKLLEIANYVSEIKAVKHPFQEGIQARRGIEF